MNFKKHFVLLLLVLPFLFSSQVVFARDAADITDWYIKDFQANIVVNKDSSLLVTENITADCGNLPDKHGIFRVLPTQSDTGSGVLKSPIELVSITDFNNKPYTYQTLSDWSNNTITWKIGDPNVTVTGVNYYRIIYKVKNAIRFGNKDFDELYWNFLGDYWDIGTDNFSAKISFPAEVNSQNAAVDYYTGAFGSKDKSLATYSWDSDNALNFNSVSTGQSPIFQPGQGLTVSVTFPKNIFTPYVPTFWEKYGNYIYDIFFLIPIWVFIFAFSKWRKFGKDPKMPKPIPPEFGIPDNITPIQMGEVLHHGTWRDEFITATIVNLAVKKVIVIEKLEQKILFLTSNDYKLTKAENYKNKDNLTEPEKAVIEGIFQDNSYTQTVSKKDGETTTTHGKDGVKLSELKDNFYLRVSAIKQSALDDVTRNGWMADDGKKYMYKFVAKGVLFIFISIFIIVMNDAVLMMFGLSTAQLGASLFLSGIIFLIFSFFMPKRTQAGVDLLFRIKGFELYMKEAEKYREKFNEKEDIFDKFLPYAIIFGIADLWAKKMQLIYGEDYFKNYHPVWYAGGNMANFDVGSFTHELNSMSSAMSSAPGSSSGSGGGGFSGGGGGGGGGGGW